MMMKEETRFARSILHDICRFRFALGSRKRLSLNITRVVSQPYITVLRIKYELVISNESLQSTTLAPHGVEQVRVQSTTELTQRQSTSGIPPSIGAFHVQRLI